MQNNCYVPEFSLILDAAIETEIIRPAPAPTRMSPFDKLLEQSGVFNELKNIENYVRETISISSYLTVLEFSLRERN